MHPLVHDGDAAGVAIAKSSPTQEMALVPEEAPFHPELGRHGPRHDAPRLDLCEGDKQPRDVGLGDRSTLEQGWLQGLPRGFSYNHLMK